MVCKISNLNINIKFRINYGTRWKRKLADELKNAADDVLNLDDMEKVAGGLLDLKCVNNNVPLCGCSQTSTEKLQQATKDQG